MRVSGIYNKRIEPETEEFPVGRIVLWAIVGLVILAGLALYFVYGRATRPLL